MRPATIHTAMNPATKSAVDRPRRLAKLRSRTCQSGAIASGSIIATTINAQPARSCPGELNSKARSSDTDSGTVLQASAEQKAGSRRALPPNASNVQAIRMIAPNGSSHD